MSSSLPVVIEREVQLVDHHGRLRWALSQLCRISTAAAWSTTARCRLPRRPRSASLREATTVDILSSDNRTGTGMIARASRPAYSRASTAAGPSRPARVTGSPTTTSTAACSATSSAIRRTPSSAAVRATVSSGAARIPSGSLTATPTRTFPTSTPSRTPRRQIWSSPVGGPSLASSDQLLDRREEAGRLLGRYPAALGQLGAASAAPGQGLLDQVGGGQAASAGRPVDRDHQRGLPARAGGHRHHGRAVAGDLAADLVGEGTHVVGAGALGRLGADVGRAAHVLRRRREPGGVAQHHLGAQLVQLLLGVAQRRHGLLDPLGDLLVGYPVQLGQPGDQQVLPRQEVERVDADQRRDPAHPGPDRRLVQDLDHPELAGARGMGTAAQLARVVADLDDADLVAVLLAEQRHRADPARLLLRGDERVHLQVAHQHLVDLLLDVVQHAGRYRLRGVEVKAQPTRCTISPGTTCWTSWISTSPSSTQISPVSGCWPPPSA